MLYNHKKNYKQIIINIHQYTRYIRINQMYITKLVYNILNVLYNMLYDMLFSCLKIIVLQ